MLIIYKKLKYFLLICLIIAIGQSCNIINPPEMVPTYFHIDSFKFNPNSQYTNISFSHKITTVWVYYNNNPVGVFDLPVTFPVNATGNGTLEVSPGINNNGLNSELVIYPFYTIDTYSFAAQPGKTIQHTPQTTFYNSLKASTLSDQNNLGFSQWGGTVGISLVPRTIDSLEFEPPNTNAGIFLNAVGDSSIDSSNKSFAIPAGQAYIELNYKCSVPFYLGLQATLNGVATSTPYYLTGIYPNSAWSKFYLNVGAFNAKYGGSSYRLYIKAALPDGQASGNVLLDHIQLISF